MSMRLTLGERLRVAAGVGIIGGVLVAPVFNKHSTYSTGDAQNTSAQKAAQAKNHQVSKTDNSSKIIDTKSPSFHFGL